MQQVTPATTIAERVAARREAYRIAGVTGHDPRTILKALTDGLDLIRSFKTREELRPHVEAWHATRSAVQS